MPPFKTYLYESTQFRAMKKIAIFALLASILTFASCDVLQEVAKNALSEPSLAEISQGLKEALKNGVGKGADALALRDGYFKSAYNKIPLVTKVNRLSFPVPPLLHHLSAGQKHLRHHAPCRSTAIGFYGINSRMKQPGMAF